jgi:hypothetical protein
VFLSFHNFDFAPGKNFVQKKSHRLLLREAVQRTDALEFTLQRGPNKLKLELQPTMSLHPPHQPRFAPTDERFQRMDLSVGTFHPLAK